MLPERRSAYFLRESRLLSGPMVNTAGRENCSFSTVIACKLREKSNGEIEILVHCFTTAPQSTTQLTLEAIPAVKLLTFCHGMTKAVFLIRTS
jgi:hypothetical protein